MLSLQHEFTNLFLVKKHRVANFVNNLRQACSEKKSIEADFFAGIKAVNTQQIKLNLPKNVIYDVHMT